MKHVVSVSLGSSSRDHLAETEILGERILIERRGTDGDVERAVALIRELDGKVDAFGMGGIDIYVHAGRRKLVIRDALKLLHAAEKTPMVDGGGIKDTWEYQIVSILERDHGIQFAGRTALVVQAVSRYGMARALVEAGARCTFGDLAFTLGVPVGIRSLGALDFLASIIAPVVCRLPISVIYPTGDKQQENKPKFPAMYRDNEFICGDFHYIKQYMPADMRGKTILTNTITVKDVELLRSRGTKLLITISPEINGRSLGANVLEAILVALSGRRPEELKERDYFEMLDRMQLKPRVEELSKPLN
jgi:hypothetical protein